jgi:ABC-type bacteriocin/lantibiotic exporter with double-glycine peptidase domain
MMRVQQCDDAGCGIACVAMVTGEAYTTIKKYFVQAGLLGHNGKPHTRHYQLRNGLSGLGISSEKRIFRCWKAIDTPAIVPTNRDKYGGWHWVVFVPDRNRPYILDPAPRRLGRRYSFRGLKARGFYISLLN